MHVSIEEHTFVTVNGLRVKIKMSYHISYHYRFSSSGGACELLKYSDYSETFRLSIYSAPM